MKAIHVTEGQPVQMTRGSIVLIFDPKEAEIAVWILELLAGNFERQFKEKMETDDLWAVAIELRKQHQIRF